MSNIRKMIGVCPQFDILWDALSSEEHLHLFASIKGLPPASIKPIAEKLLADVKLTGAAKIRAGSYSGGMKRRLSVAIALIGDPKLVFLDEPLKMAVYVSGSTRVKAQSNTSERAHLHQRSSSQQDQVLSSSVTEKLSTESTSQLPIHNSFALLSICCAG
ncbi:hypothetical protein DY000_02026381 [Brassica cretica]|uniref:ABC transporter domain-containing protein n=1 Tax=Brassica cretica TaxID=69181 RepID=A0ABQ7EME0_BRACR|nr:hypothetical protein DY000_02026381 [Brassica cretica]